MKKKILLSLVLMCISILAFMPTNVLGITPTRTFGDLTYRIIDDSYIFIINCDTSATNVVIPEQIASLPVTKISSSAFRDCVNLESVSIPKSVNLMEVNTFSGCDKLTTIWWNPRYIRNDYQTFSSEDNICGNAGIDGDGLKVFLVIALKVSRHIYLLTI